jgi:hypothetical protein
MKIIAKITMLLFVAAALVQSTSCAWFQKNEPKLVCAGEATVADLPELVTIITTCSAISVGAENIVPCILAAAGSKWPEEVIACVANAQASKIVSPATAGPSVKPNNIARLRGAVSAKWGRQLGLQ